MTTPDDLERELQQQPQKIAELEQERDGLLGRLADACSHANASLLARAESLQSQLAAAQEALEVIAAQVESIRNKAANDRKMICATCGSDRFKERCKLADITQCSMVGAAQGDPS